MARDTRAGGAALVVDDDARLRALVSTLLQRLGCTVSEAADGEAALELVRANQPDLVILDVSLPRVTGYEVCRELRDLYGDSVAIMFVSGARPDALDRVAGLLIGADDCLAKPFEPDELLGRARVLLERGRRLQPRPVQGVGASLLTPREREVLGLLARGQNQKQIARELVISPHTVATHIQRTLAKLGVNSRAQAVAHAHEAGLVPEVELHALSFT